MIEWNALEMLWERHTVHDPARDETFELLSFSIRKIRDGILGAVVEEQHSWKANH